MLIFTNSSLPVTVPNPFNLSAPVANFKTGQSSVPLVVVNSFYKYGVTPQVTEITNPDATYNLYRLSFPFPSVLSLGIDGFIRVEDVDRLTGQRYWLEGTVAYVAASTPPDNYRIIVEITAPIPRVACELIASVPAGMAVEQILYKGIPLNFGQSGQQLTIDCSDSCCRIRGGEILEVKGVYINTPILINQIHVFRIEGNLGLIDYIEWRGKRFAAQQGELGTGQFLYDGRAKSLKLIL